MVLVESHDDTRALYAEYLRQHGYTVRTAATTDQALELSAGAAAVITGLGVRGSFDGLELIGRIRADAASPRTPIIVLTAHSFEEHRRRALEAGADVFLAKPCLPEELLAEVERMAPLAKIRKPKPARVSSPRRRSRRVS